MFTECFEIEEVFFNVDKINIEDIIAKINDFPIKKKNFLYQIIRKVFRIRIFHRNQVNKIVEFLSSKYNDSVEHIFYHYDIYLLQ